MSVSHKSCAHSDERHQGRNSKESSTSGHRWYAVNTLPRAELRSLCNLERQGYSCFNPRTSRTFRHGHRFVTRDVSLFPSYVFTRFDRNYSQWHSINSTYGVKRLLTIGDTPAPLPAGFIETLQSMVNEESWIDFATQIRTGEQVQFSRGPFANLIGQLETLDDKGRVLILLSVLGRDTHVRATARDVMAVY